MYGQQTRVQKYCKFFRKQHTIDKFDAVIEQLDEHSEKAWQLADSNNMAVRRRGMRASFSQGLQRSNVAASSNSVFFDHPDQPGKHMIGNPSEVNMLTPAAQLTIHNHNDLPGSLLNANMPCVLGPATM